MAKKSKKTNLNFILLIVSAVLGVLATAMIFFPAFVGQAFVDLTISGSSDKLSFTGLQASFGFTEVTRFSESITYTNEILTTNFFSLMSFFMPLIAVVFLVLFRDKKIVNYICAGALISAGIFAFVSLNTFSGSIVDEIYKAYYDFKLGAGSVLCGIFSISSGLVALAKIVITNK